MAENKSPLMESLDAVAAAAEGSPPSQAAIEAAARAWLEDIVKNAMETRPELLTNLCFEVAVQVFTAPLKDEDFAKIPAPVMAGVVTGPQQVALLHSMMLAASGMLEAPAIPPSGGLLDARGRPLN